MGLLVELKVLIGEVLGPDGWTIEAKVPAALEDAIDDGLCEVVIVQDGAPALRVLVGGEDHRAASDVALV